MTQGLVGVLLAAGAGSRFGADKRLHLLPDGTPMAVASAAMLRSVCGRVVAVVRPDDSDLATLLAVAGCEIVRSADAGLGMGHSLAAGVCATAEASGWIVALADMPFITRSSYAAVAESLRSGATLVACQYRGRRGHPVGFARAWFAQLQAMNGDYGAKALLEEHRDALTICAVEDPGVVWDIDTPDDLHVGKSQTFQF